MTARAGGCPPSDRWRMLLLGLVVPSIVIAVATVIVRGWVPYLPQRIAVHWSPAGPDGFATASGWWWLPLLVLLAPIACTLVAWWLGVDPLTRRMCLATDWFVTAFLVSLVLLMLDAQIGLADAREMGDIDPLISIALVIGLAAGVLGWLLIRPGSSSGSPARLDAATAHLAVRDGERIVWTHVVRTPYLIPVTLGVVGVVWVVLVVVHAYSALVLIVGVAALLLVLEALFSSARVTVDESGLRVVFGPGIKVRSIAARDVQDVAVVDVHPLRQFGGYGVRTGLRGAVGVIMRKGPGIKVTLGDKREFVVTIDDAATGAAALATVALRAQRP